MERSQSVDLVLTLQDIEISVQAKLIGMAAVSAVDEAAMGSIRPNISRDHTPR